MFIRDTVKLKNICRVLRRLLVTKQRFVLIFSLVFILALIAALGLTTSPTEAHGLVQPGNPAGTMGAIQTRIAKTATALKFQILGSATAFKNNFSGTATTIRNSAVGTGTAVASNLRATLTALKGTLTRDQVAVQAIETYAAQVLGIQVSVTAAGTITQQVTRDQAHLETSQKAQAQAVDLAVKSYGALLKNGAASISYGSGTITNDVTIDVQDASLAVYSLGTTYNGALSLERLFDLAIKTYPGLTGRPYAQMDVKTGFAWYAQSSVSVVDPVTRKLKNTSEVVILYIYRGQQNRVSVTAVVGRGDFATLLVQ
jgi:hypothetical protein